MQQDDTMDTEAMGSINNNNNNHNNNNNQQKHSGSA
jgi:hypothetical protein